MTYLRSPLALTVFALASLAACGGSTTSDIGSTGQAGQGQAGQGQAGQGQAGQAGQGQAGAATWSLCQKPGECLVAPASCCGSCGAPTPADKDGVNKTKIGEHQAAVCPPDGGCPACFMETSKDLLGVCRTGSCSAIEISKDTISACATDADCVLRTPGDCCNCGGATEKSAYVAVSTAGMTEYLANACADQSGVCGCPAPPPPKFKAQCGATKHCEVVAVTPAVGCPATVPASGAACPAKGLDCEYGESLIPSCRTHAICEGNGKWSVAAVKCQSTSPAGQNGCPSDVSASGSMCDPKLEGKVCDMGGSATCLCSSCLGGPCMQLPRWGCASAPALPCPALAPNQGQPCPSEGAICNYGVICSSTGARKLCKGGVWENDLIACAN